MIIFVVNTLLAVSCVIYSYKFDGVKQAGLSCMSMFSAGVFLVLGVLSLVDWLNA